MNVKLDTPEDAVPHRYLPLRPSYLAGPGTSHSSDSSSHPSPPSRSAEMRVFMAPLVPPANCPLQNLSRNAHGHRCFEPVSQRPLRVEHEFTILIASYRSDPLARCSHCAAIGTACDFESGWGVGCGTCFLLGHDDCEFADPSFFHAQLTEFRDRYLLDQWRRAESDMTNEGLSATLAHARYDESLEWFYRGAQGAIDRFTMLRRITRPLAHRGYQQMAAASDDPQHLARCLVHAFEHGLHPSVIDIITSRISELVASTRTL
ncbi:hypothetical protein C8F01DRAFT_1156834 [Mycena amicta]|nr:hypothetical protein C8F01DRAFT_1156834 [Mycena amicta]